VQDDVVAVAHGRILGHDDGRAELFGFGEGEDGAGVVLGEADRLHLGEHLDAGLGLLGLGRLGLEAVDEGLEMGAAVLLLLGLGEEVGALLGPLAGELVVGAGPVGELLLGQVEDAGDGAVQELAVVGDDQDGVGVLDEVGFQPERAFEVEVVRGLVEEEEVGLGEEDGGQGHAHPPAAREVGAGLARLLVGEAQALEDGGGARLAGPGVDVGEAGLDLGDAVGVLGGVGFAEQGLALGVGCEDGVQEGDVVAGNLLRDAADAGAAGDLDGAGVERELAADEAEERGLAGAVAAHEADLVAGGMVAEACSMRGRPSTE
jgi:hypothetical protein